MRKMSEKVGESAKVLKACKGFKKKVFSIESKCARTMAKTVVVCRV